MAARSRSPADYEENDMAKYVFVVFTEPVDGQDTEYNEWYSDVHIPDVLKLDEVVAARRYKLAAMDPPQDGHRPYLALYEIEADDISKIPGAIQLAIKEGRMPISAALDRSKNHVAYYEAL
jgi:hypothetical protein